ncbi:hypothetical protein AY599_21735 [Leptolyngbya valderiana BDU 20041]|nr:hypothetical protein [Geitlerinema sp. CS-897]OAB62453.1 hypothetical protein AY599_21735 [Leptolyngbya valderiana BDU 20041]PPT08557.1 hypothetical protein CKA32_004916 [Geitlerinema sp. FC II]
MKRKFQSDEAIIKLRLRHANFAFFLNWTAQGASLMVVLIGVALIFSGRIPHGSLSAVSGLFSQVATAKLAKDANDRLDRIAEDILEADNEDEGDR